MMLPLIIFLYIYLALAFIFCLFAFFNLYHMVRFSFWTFASFLATFLFLAGTVIIFFLSFEEIRAVNWQQTVDVGSWAISLF